MGIQVRPATTADHPAIARLTVDAYRADGQLEAETGRYADVLADVAGRADQTEILVAVDSDGGADGGVLGAVAFVLPGSAFAELARPGEAEFRMLAVDPSAQGRGVGQALVRACVARAREVRASGILIFTRSFAERAQRFYTRMGFVRAPEHDRSPMPGVDLLALHLPITPAEV